MTPTIADLLHLTADNMTFMESLTKFPDNWKELPVSLQEDKAVTVNAYEYK